MRLRGTLRGTVLGLSLLVCACEGSGEEGAVDQVSRSIINGTDDRVEISQASTGVQEVAKAALGAFYTGLVVQNADGTYHLNDTPSQPGLCADQRFASEHSKAQCSASLIAPDLALTAGHCLDDYASLTSLRFVLGYNDASGFGPSYANIPAQNVFSATAKIYDTGDIAVVRLDHAAPSTAKPFRISNLDLTTAGIPSTRIPVAAIGAPLGLPLKYASNGLIKSIDSISIPPYFTFDTNLDLQAGNSGSPLFDPTSNLTYGIFTNGDLDTAWDPTAGCYRWLTCDPNVGYCREIGKPALPVAPFTQPAGSPLDPTYDLFGRFTIGSPYAIGASDGNEYVFITGENNRLYYRVRTPSAGLGPWQEVPGGGLSPSGPSVAEYRGLLYLYVRGTDNNLYLTYLTLSTGSWVGYWIAMPQPTYPFSPAYGVIDSPGVLSTRFQGSNYVDEDLTVFVRGPSDRLFTNTYKYRTWQGNYPPYQGWAGWTLLVGSPNSAPRAVTRPGGQGYLFFRSADGTLHMRQYFTCAVTFYGGCFAGNEITVPPGPLTNSEPGTIAFDNDYWLMVRGKDDDEVYYIDGNNQGGFNGSWGVLNSGKAFSGPTGSVYGGIWWLYTKAADGRPYRY
jgi:V8-like Glu-specific endopeptidase